jgi:hypothetical protein
MKALNVFLTLVIYLAGCFFFTPLCMALGLPGDASLKTISQIGLITSSFFGGLFACICAKKFYKWFNSRIK